MDIDVFQLPAILRRRIVYVVATAAVCACLGFAFVAVQPKLYRAIAEILIDPEKLPAVGQTAVDTVAPAQAQQSVDSQIYVMQSQEILIETVRRLNLQKDAVLQPRPGLLGRLLGKTTAPAVDETAQLSNAAVALYKLITITRAEQSLVYDISVRYPDAQKAAEIANTIATVYIEKSDSVRSDSGLRASMGLQVQAEDLRKRLLEAEEKVEKFKTENGLISTGVQGLVSDQQLQGISQQLINAKAALEQQQASYDQVKGLTMRDLEAGAIPETLQLTSVSALRTRYAQTLDRQAELETHLGARHPQLQTARSQVASMRTQLEAELQRVQASFRNNYERAKVNVAALQTRFDALQNANGADGDVRTRLRQFESERDAIQGVYKAFLTRAEELGRQHEIGAGNSRIISKALPPAQTTGASSVLVVIAGLLFGIAAGSALAVGRELLDDTALTHRQIAERLGVPILSFVAPRRHGNIAAQPSALQRFLQKASFNGADRSIERIRAMAVTRIASVLTDCLGDTLPATVVFVSAGDERLDHTLVADIAEALADEGAEVAYAPGSFLRLTPVARTLRAVRGEATSWLDTLDYQRLNAPASQGLMLSGSGLSAMRGRLPARSQGGYTLVDACGTDVATQMVKLFNSADVVMIMVKPGQTSRRALSDLALAIAPWKKKVVGSIVIEGDR